MATNWTTFPIKLEGGLISTMGKLEQGASLPGSAIHLQNFEPDVKGGYSRIQGYSKFSASQVPLGPAQIGGVVTLSQSEALAERGGRLFYSSGGAWSTKLISVSTGGSFLRSDTYNFNGTKKFVIVDGVNTPMVFDYPAKTLAYMVGVPSDAIGASFVKVFKSHIFFSTGRMLTFTAPFSESFDVAIGAGAVNLSENITGMAVFRDQLFIFCENSIQVLAGNSVSDFTLSPVTTNTGCIAGGTICEIGGDIMYLARDGIRYLSSSANENDFGLTRASKNIQDQITGLLVAGAKFSAHTLSEKGQYRLFSFLSSVPSGESEGFLATKYSDQSSSGTAWAKIRGMKVADCSKYSDTVAETVLFVSDTGFVYRAESGSTFDGGQVEAVFQTPFMPISDPLVRKTLYKHHLYVTPTGPVDITASMLVDYESVANPATSFTLSVGQGANLYGSPSTIYGTSVFSELEEEVVTNNILGSGKTISFRYYNKSISSPFNINFLTLEYRNNERT